MNLATYKRLRALVAAFVGITVSTAMTQNSFVLAIAGTVTGMLFMILVRSKTKIKVDEREKAIREKAAQYAYATFVPMIGLGSVAVTFLGIKTETAYMSSLGMILSYLTLLLITIYSIAYHFVNKRFGGGGNEE